MPKTFHTEYSDTAIFRLTEIFFAVFRTRLTNVLVDVRANMNGRAIPGAYLFRLLHYWKEFQSLATKWHPNKAEMNRLCALVEDKCLNHFKNILKKKKFNQFWTDFLLLL